MKGFPRRAAAHKYRARETDCGYGHAHPSRREAIRCAELHLLQRAGEIAALEIEPRYYFEINGAVLTHDNGRRAVYTPDFRYRRVADGQIVVEDTKGMRVRDWPLRKALFLALNPDVEFHER